MRPQGRAAARPIRLAPRSGARPTADRDRPLWAVGLCCSPTDWTLEVVVLSVADIDRAVAFYRDQVGFDLDHDTTNEHMHVVQLTPRGSGCSIVFGDLPAQPCRNSSCVARSR